MVFGQHKVINLTPDIQRWKPDVRDDDADMVVQDNRLPLPLPQARDILLRVLKDDGFLEQTEDPTWHEGNAERSMHAVQSQRLEVLVDPEELGTGEGAPLAWFCGQPPARNTRLEDPTLPRVFLRTPSVVEDAPNDKPGVAAAGIGAAHVLTGDGRLEDGALQQACSVGPAMRYYGGARFQTLDGLGSAAEAGEDEGPPDEAHAEGSMRGKKGMQASPEWKAFGDHWLVLPLVELSTSSTDCPGARGDKGKLTLAVNLRWTASGGESSDKGAEGGTTPGRARGESRCAPQGLSGRTGASESLASVRARAIRALEWMSCRYARPGDEAELPQSTGDANGSDLVHGEDGDEYKRWEKGINRVLEDMQQKRYSKIVLARTILLSFRAPVPPAEMVTRLRDHQGFLFCLQNYGVTPKADRIASLTRVALLVDSTFPMLVQFAPQPDAMSAFLGCTPERLFLLSGSTVITEALAGTRPRGSTPAEDEQLAVELLASAKDLSENAFTADYVSEALRRAGAMRPEVSEVFLRRLKHVQHICRRIVARVPLSSGATEADTTGASLEGESHEEGLNASQGAEKLETWTASPGREEPGGASPGAVAGQLRSGSGAGANARALLAGMHPTPAVCGTPRDLTYAIIREIENFDRGFYAGPVGYVSAAGSEFGVAIRSALVREHDDGAGSSMTLYAGAGIVPGSTARGEWLETQCKMRNFLALFRPRHVSGLRNLPNMNTLWATMVVEELVRSGVRHFCVCPGSRCTPLTMAIARNPSVVAVSHHDERGAAFYAIGFARATSGDGSLRPRGLCAIVTTSGTAVANLLPAACEADAAGLPLMFLTADRPAEARFNGSNQTIDQVKIFGDRARMAVDLPCPADDISAAFLLSEVDRGVQAAFGGGGVGCANVRGQPGLVHLNFMFPENLAPTGGAVRGASVSGLTSEWSPRCLESPRLLRWESAGVPYTSTVAGGGSGGRGYGATALDEVADVLVTARRGMLLFGSIRGPRERAFAKRLATILQWPVYTDVTSGLRVWCGQAGLGVGRLDQMLLDEAFAEAIAPDVLLQVGWPQISMRVQQFISSPATAITARVNYVCSPLGAWYDPDRGFTSRLACSTEELVAAVDAAIQNAGASLPPGCPGSDLLAPLVEASDAVERAQTAVLFAALEASKVTPQSLTPPTPMDGASDTVEARERGRVHSEKTTPLTETLTEPFVSWCLSTVIAPEAGLFLSASMPCRDVNAFADSGGGFFDATERCEPAVARGDGEGVEGMECPRLSRVATNRGANGIDGVISSTMGYANGLRAPVTLLIGDIATLHDVGSLHALRGLDAASTPVTIVCINNGGGGIFSFLPIAQPAFRDSFTPLFDTPHVVNFEGICRSLGLAYRKAETCQQFHEAYLESQDGSKRVRKHYLIEVLTRGRDDNVTVHGSLGRVAKDAALKYILKDLRLGWEFTPRLRRPPASSSTAAPGVSSGSVGTSVRTTTFAPTANGVTAPAPSVAPANMPSSCSSLAEGAPRGRHGRPTLLLLHGFMGSKEDWAGEFMEMALAAGHAILSVELPGHGGVSTTGHHFSHPCLRRGARKSAGAAEESDERVESSGLNAYVPWGLGGVYTAAEGIAAICDSVGAGPYLAVGYSMGGRIALALAARRPDLLKGGGLALVSSSPGLSRAADRLERWTADCALASRIAGLGLRRQHPSSGCSNVAVNPAPEAKLDKSGSSGEGTLNGDASLTRMGREEAGTWPGKDETEIFLQNWYAAPLWGALQRRRPGEYSSMIRRRLVFGFRLGRPDGDSDETAGVEKVGAGEDLSRSCVALSVARQADLLPVLRCLRERHGIPAIYVAGAEDVRYGATGEAVGRALSTSRFPPPSCPKTVMELITSTCPDVEVAIVSDCGHAVPTEAPTALFQQVYRLASLSTNAEETAPDPQEDTESKPSAPARPHDAPVSEGPLMAKDQQRGKVSQKAASIADPDAGQELSEGRLSGVTIADFALEEFSIAMKAPLQLSTCRLTERRGVLIRLKGRAPVDVADTGANPSRTGDGGRFSWGVGEVTPLPGFHVETLEEATAQLRAALRLLVGRQVPLQLASLDVDKLDAWLSKALSSLGPDAGVASTVTVSGDMIASCGEGANGGQDSKKAFPSKKVDESRGSVLFPSVRCGLEMALVHLVASAAGMSIAVAMSSESGLPCRATVEINSLSARTERPSSFDKSAAGRVMKVKVGGETGPVRDAEYVLELLAAAPDGSSLRLDANQAWSMEDALAFCEVIERGRHGGSEVDGSALEQGRGSIKSKIEYLEEPLRDPRMLGEFWERSGKDLPYALDESLGMERESALKDDELARLEGCAAFVIKISVAGGLGRAMRLCRLAQRLGAKAVLSSAFESGVGLAHAAILASVFAVEGVAHGLSTYSRLSGDVSSPGFAEAVAGNAVDTMMCQALLDRVARGGSVG